METQHTHTLTNTRTVSALSLSLSRTGVPVANHRATERGSYMTLTLRHTHTHTEIHTKTQHNMEVVSCSCTSKDKRSEEMETIEQNWKQLNIWLNIVYRPLHSKSSRHVTILIKSVFLQNTCGQGKSTDTAPWQYSTGYTGLSKNVNCISGGS